MRDSLNSLEIWQLIKPNLNDSVNSIDVELIVVPLRCVWCPIEGRKASDFANETTVGVAEQ